jgi:predicted N-acetyltransferase YhbS
MTALRTLAIALCFLFRSKLLDAKLMASDAAHKPPAVCIIRSFSDEDHMDITLRSPTPDDLSALAQLVFEAFATFHDRHHFPRDFAGPEMAVGLMQAWVNDPRVWGTVAIAPDGRIIGCNFLDERNEVPGVGPVCVDPASQGRGIGRRVMEAVLSRARQIGARSVRLVQEPFNTVSMSLYASLGFEVREPLALMQGRPAAQPAGGSQVRPMTADDLPGCAELCRRVHGFDRTGELRDALSHFHPFVVERGGKMTAYSAAPGLWLMNHIVAEGEDDMRQLLLGSAGQLGGEPISLLVPIRNAAMFRWCLEQKLRVVKPLTLMVQGDYSEPRGWWAPSVEY